MKKKLPCVYISTAPLLSRRLPQSWGSLGCPLSPYALLSTALLYKKWVLSKPCLSQFQPLWSKVNRGKGKPQPFRWLVLVQDKTWRACHLAEHCHQQTAPVPQEKDGCPVFRRERRSRSTVAWFSDLAVGVPLLPMHTYFQQSRLERRQSVKGCPAELSCALGPNLVSQ